MLTWYILLKDKIASSREGSLLRGTNTGETHVLPGSLWTPVATSTDAVGTGLHSHIALESVEYDGELLLSLPLSFMLLIFDLDVKMKAAAPDIARITEEDFMLLLAITTCLKRIEMYNDAEMMKNARALAVVQQAVITTGCF